MPMLANKVSHKILSIVHYGFPVRSLYQGVRILLRWGIVLTLGLLSSFTLIVKNNREKKRMLHFPKMSQLFASWL